MSHTKSTLRTALCGDLFLRWNQLIFSLVDDNLDGAQRGRDLKLWFMNEGIFFSLFEERFCDLLAMFLGWPAGRDFFLSNCHFNNFFIDFHEGKTQIFHPPTEKKTWCIAKNGFYCNKIVPFLWDYLNPKHNWIHFHFFPLFNRHDERLLFHYAIN